MARYIDADLYLDTVKQNSPYIHTIAALMMSVVPVADVAEVKHGKWTSIGLRNPQCSLCHKYNYEESRFCPNCGAKMDLEEGAQE